MDIENYCSLEQKRPVVDCKAERAQLNCLDDHIGSIVKGHAPIFKDALFKCKHCKEEKENPRQFVRRSNTVAVVSLKYGPFRALFWTGHANIVESGIRILDDEIFPLCKKSAYCTDFLYTLLDLVCRHGMPLRRAFASLKIGPFMTGLLFDHANKCKVPVTGSKGAMSRRRVTEAWFLMSFSVLTQQQSDQIFHCKDCEVPLSEAYRRELGISYNNPSLRRPTAIVIDGTSAIIKRKLAHFDREYEKLSVASIIAPQKVNSRKIGKSTIRKFCNMTRDAMCRLIKKGRQVSVLFDLENPKEVMTPKELKYFKKYY